MLPLANGHKVIAILISQLEKRGILTTRGKINLNYKDSTEQKEKK